MLFPSVSHPPSLLHPLRLFKKKAPKEFGRTRQKATNLKKAMGKISISATWIIQMARNVVDKAWI